MEPHVGTLRSWFSFGKTLGADPMFYVYDLPRTNNDQAINIADIERNAFLSSDKIMTSAPGGDEDIDFVDDTLLNTSPHNPIEQQLLRGDMVGLALMSGAILWSAMGAFG